MSWQDTLAQAVNDSPLAELLECGMVGAFLLRPDGKFQVIIKAEHGDGFGTYSDLGRAFVAGIERGQFILTHKEEIINDGRLPHD